MKTINGIVKLSGNNLGYNNDVSYEGDNIDPTKVAEYGQNIFDLYKRRINPFVIIGGSNIANGEKLLESGAITDKRIADLMGMEATHTNVKAVYEVLKEMDIPVIMLSTLGKSEDGFVPYDYPKLLELSNQKEIVCLIAGGTGHTGFTTDTAAAIFANDIGMTKIVKSTAAGVIYNSDPKKESNLIKLQRYFFISYQDVIAQDLKFMDLTAIAYCKQNNIDIHVTKTEDADTLERILRYDENPYGSIVSTPKKVEELLLKCRY